jgi:predicted RNA polymerase sigma factor
MSDGVKTRRPIDTKESPADALEDVGDDRLRLCGLDTREIARAFLVTVDGGSTPRAGEEGAVAGGCRFEMPSPPEMSEGLASVLEVVYLLFDEGPFGDVRGEWLRLIRRGLEALARAESLDAPIGPYVIQAGIAPCHTRAARIEDTDSPRIALLYEALFGLWPTPVVALNRAVAIGMARDPREGLAAIDALVATGALASYPHLHAAQAPPVTESGA